MNLDEILTGTIGFIIAMTLIGAALGGVIYGYYAYAQHQILENYLWPVVEAVPAQGGGYWLAVINTGHEPLIVKYLIYPNGQSQTVNSGTLYQNQHWMTQLSQLPAEVMVCSAVNPNVCVTAPVHGYYIANTATFSGPGNSNNTNSNGLIEVIVYDPYNAGWSVSWNYYNGITIGNIRNAAFTESGNTTYEWFINPPYVPIKISFSASITQNPPNLYCWIQPSSITNTYSAGSVQVFNVECTANYVKFILDPGACWSVNIYGVIYATQSSSVKVWDEFGSWSYSSNWANPGETVTTYWIPTNGDLMWFDAQGFSSTSSATFEIVNWTTWPNTQVIYSTSQWKYQWPSYYVNPVQILTGPNQTYLIEVNINCNSGSSNSISVNVEDSYGAGWSVVWSGAASGSKSGSSSTSWTISTTGTVSFTASITSVPSGYSSCSISPTSTSAGPGNTVTFTVSCTQTPPPSGNGQPGCYLTTSATSNPSGIPVTVNPSGTTFLSPGQSVTVQFNAPTSQTISTTPYGEYWYQFIDWVITANPGGYTSLPTNPYTTAKTNPSVTVTCPSGLNSTVNIQVSGTANYQEDYYTVSGPTEVSQSGDYTVTLSWNLAPAYVWEVIWNINPTPSSVNINPINIYASNHYYQASWYITPAPDACPSGWTPIITGVSPTGTITQNIGDETSGSTSITLDITLTCQPPGRNTG